MLDTYYSSSSIGTPIPTTNENIGQLKKKPLVEFRHSDIIDDLGDRKAIDEHPPEIGD